MLEYGQKLTLGEEKREGHNFAGWSDGNRVYRAGETITVKENMNLTALWDVKQFTITFVLPDGATRTETVAYGKTVTLGEETRKGYIFAGWSDGANTYAAGESLTVTGDLTLTAVWKENPSAADLPKTGDESPVLLWGAVLAVSVAACFALKRKK